MENDVNDTELGSIISSPLNSTCPGSSSRTRRTRLEREADRRDLLLSLVSMTHYD